MIYFNTPTVAPIEALTTLGVSVKGEGAIGYFGTGFKFALSTLLRTGHKIWFNDIPFTSRETEIRGKTFQIVQYDGRDLGFTTELGKNWTPLQAFRELHSNVLDEGGSTTRHPIPAKTIIRVEGAGIETAFEERDKIFLATSPLLRDNYVSIHPGSTDRVYYRGVYAGTFPYPALFTYNMLATSSLSEDRNLTQHYTIVRYATESIAESDDEDLIKAVILAKKGMMEALFDFSAVNPSPTFLKTVESCRSFAGINPTALGQLSKRTPSKAEPDPIELTQNEVEVVRAAMELCSRLNATPKDVVFVETLGPSVLGLTRNSHIYIARDAINQGARRLASTLYEEWCHVTHNYDDCSRAFQNFLLDRLFAQVDR